MRKPSALKYIALTMLATAACNQRAEAYAKTYYASNSALQSGRWVKIHVTQSGMQQITADQLKEWGFSDLSKVSVYGYGGISLNADQFLSTLPDDLPQQPVVRLDDRILFYGEGDVQMYLSNDNSMVALRNHYSNGGYYFITDSREPAQAKVSAFNNAVGTTIDWHISGHYFEEELQNPAAAGAHFFGQSLSASEPYEFTFDLKDLYRDTSIGKNIQWRPQLGFDVSHNVTYTFGDGSTRSYTYSPASGSTGAYFAATQLFTINIASVEGESYTASLAISPSGESSFAALDNMMYYYPRHNRLNGDAQLQMHYSVMRTDQRHDIYGTDANTMVWDIPSASNVSIMETKFDAENGVTSFTPVRYSAAKYGGVGRVIVFDPGKQMYSVEYAGEVANTNLHGAPTPQMLIITTDNCREQAERLARLHREHQGLDVLVVSQQQVFDEFSSGTPDAMGIRRLCKMFYDRDRTRFKYLLLFGAGSYDNRALMHTNVQSRELLMTYVAREKEISGSLTSSYTNDAYYAMLADTNESSIVAGRMEIAVGRIPTLTPAEATAVVNKIEHYLTTTPDPEMYEAAMVLGDDGNGNAHTDQQEEVAQLINSLSPATTVYKIYDNIFPVDASDKLSHSSQRYTTERLRAGTAFFNYAGHGNADAFTGTQLWTRRLVRETEYDNQPLAMLATCDSYSFDRMDDGIAYNMLIKEHGGMIAVIGACRTVFKDHNHTLAMAVTKQFYNPEVTTLGDVYRLAYNDVMGSALNSQLRYNTACYNFGGDPALPTRHFGAEAHVAAVNGADAAVETVHVQARKFNTVSGNITDAAGNRLQNFNGTATITIYDAPRKQRTLSQGDGKTDGDPLKYYTFDEFRLASVKVPVTDGGFDAKLYLPIPRTPGQTNRMVVSALSADGSLMASGNCNNIVVDEYDMADIDESTAPVITDMYINTPDFVDGSQIGCDLTLYATVDPGTSGLRTSTGGIDAPMSLKLDNITSLTRATTAYTLNTDGTVSVRVPVTSVRDGRHTLTLTVTNAAGMNASRDISFSVLNGTADATLTIGGKVATTDAIIDIKHNMSYAPTGRLIIEDSTGNMVRSVADCSFPYTWDLKDAAGNDVANGTYHVYTIINSGSYYTSTPRAEINVFK